MFNKIKMTLSKLNQHLSSLLNEANSVGGTLNTQYCVDWCHPVFVVTPHWHAESASEFALLISQSSHSSQLCNS